MTALEIFDRKQQEEKDCLSCPHLVIRQRNTGVVHFCGKSGKLILYPSYIPKMKNCESLKGEGADD